MTEASEVRRRGRQRLIGAIALVAVLVVFVPMILDSQPKQPKDGPTLAIPSRTNAPPLPAPPKAAAKPVEAPAPVAPAKAGAQSPEPAKAAPVTPAKADPVTPAKADPVTPAKADPVTPAKADPVTPAKADPVTPAKAGAQSAAPRLEGFAVQVGAFRDEAKLDQARQKLASAKIPHYTERLESKSGPLTRLRAGPFPTRDAAESALATLKRAALEGKVVPLP